MPQDVPRIQATNRRAPGPDTRQPFPLRVFKVRYLHPVEKTECEKVLMGHVVQVTDHTLVVYELIYSGEGIVQKAAGGVREWMDFDEAGMPIAMITETIQ